MAWYQMGHQCSASVLTVGTIEMIDKTFQAMFSEPIMMFFMVVLLVGCVAGMLLHWFRSMREGAR